MASNGGARVSVVTPVYNGEKHLETCIKSVLAQTYSNFEYIIINNCSTDRTLEIASAFADRDRRIKVISNASLLNVVESHNKAFSVAPPENEYIKILGADDWLFPDCLAEMVGLAEANPSVGMVTSYVLMGSKVGYDGLRFDGLPYKGSVIKGRDACRMRFLDRVYVFGGPSASLLRTGAVKEHLPFYTVGNYHGDNDAYLRLLQRHDFGFVHQVLTYKRRGEDSRTTYYLDSVNSFLLSVVEELVMFGPLFLTPGELQTRLQDANNEYYMFLADQLFKFRSTAFWNYHLGRLKILGPGLNYAKLARFALLRLIDRLLNPKRTTEGVIRRILNRR
jgi:glycosyltransferase involved in cell wall biosynthesis